MKLSPAEIAAKEAALSSLGDIIRACWPEAIITTSRLLDLGLVLPNSPVEISLGGTGEDEAKITTLADALLETGNAETLERITTSHMPCVKVTWQQHRFDIYFD